MNALLVACAAALTMSADIPTPTNGEWRDVEIEATPHALRGDAAPGDALKIGALIYRGGLVLSSPDPAFGGLSGLVIENDGARLLAVSDRGQWLEAALRYDAEGRLAGAANAQMSAIADKDGVVLAGPIADAEGLSRSEDGRYFVSFEREHRIDAYRRDGDGLLVFDFRLADLAEDAPPLNQGVESVAVLDDGVLALAEAPFALGATALFIGPDGVRHDVAFSPATGFAATEATRADGDLFILERAYSPWRGVRARISRARLPSAADLEIKDAEIARFALPYDIDNFEGLDVRRTDGRTFFYIVSDDNYSRRQKTLLLMFELVD